jgi:hypothetical protein
MRKARRAVLAGLGAITPAFIATTEVQAQTAEGTTVAPAQIDAQAMAVEQEALKHALLGLSSAEKLRIAGDRIRLAKVKASTQSRSRAARPATQVGCITQITCMTSCTATCAGQRRAR